jgi:sulfite reductase alpha subunit-like flavoprotein
LIETLGIRGGTLPQVTLETNNPTSIRHKYTKTARNHLCNWLKDTKFTQTHALRHLANLNGMMAGVSLEKRAMSLGHSPSMNDQVYKRRQTTRTTIDLLTQTNRQALPLETAIAIAKQLECTDKKSVALLSSIYGLPEDVISKLLNT